MIQTAVIPVGGMGTRMRSVSATCPKPLLEVCGKTIIEHILDSLEYSSVKNVIFTVSYKSDQFEKYIALLSMRYSFNFQIYFEPVPLGECGAYGCSKPIFITYCYTVTPV